MPADPTAIAKLGDLLAAIRRYDDPRRASAEWRQAYALLQKTGLPAARVSGAIGMRDVEELAALIAELQAPPSAASAADAPDAETCANALAAFRKRISLMILDEQSKLGRNPLTKGGEPTIAGIAPPAGWSNAVWEALCVQGKLRYIGHGLYQLPRE